MKAGMCLIKPEATNPSATGPQIQNHIGTINKI